MAGTKKSGGKSGGTKKSSSPKNPKPQTGGTRSAPEGSPVSQFWSVILFAVGILTFLLTVIEGSSGWNAIHHVLRGLFGVSIFMVPVILIYTAVLIGMERSQHTVFGRAVWGIGLVLLSSSVVQVMFAGAPQGDTFIQKCKYLYELGTELEGGGMLSALIAWPLMKFFGVIGARIIVCVLLFVFVMLLSNLTLFQLFELLTRPFKKMYAAMKNIREENRILDAYEEWEYDEEQEAIQLANSVPESTDTVPDYDINMDVPEDDTIIAPPDFGTPEWSGGDVSAIDIPIDGVILNEAPEQEASLEKNTENVSFDGSGELDAIVSRAVSGGDKNVMPESFAEKAARAEENAEKAEIQGNNTREYILPSPGYLNKSVSKANDPAAAAELKQKADMLIETLKSFGVNASIIGIQRGPRVTRYEVKPAAGVKVSKITNLSDDIALNLAAAGVRIEAPIPGKAAIGIEIPNTNEDIVSLREIFESKEFQTAKSKLVFAVGKDIAGNVIIGDVAKMPHMIIAGTTGSGKSVCTNSIIMSILFRATPDEVKLILIDPKMVEFTTYNGIPHLLIPVVTDPRQAAGALNWSVQEMLRRYKLFSDNSVKDISGYNELADRKKMDRLPQIVIAIDEFADLMMAASKEVEDAVCRLAQMARAAGMHLIIATQRPTTDVITGLIKANIPSRIALTVQSQVDSRTILDTQGAEKLLGYGDMLYYPNGMQKPLRVQGCFCSSKEVETIVDFIKQESETDYNEEIVEAVEQSMPAEKSSDIPEPSGSGDDALIEKAIDIAVDMGQVSTSALQRKLKLGFARAARIVDELEEMGVVGPSEGAKPRKVLMSKQQWAERRARKSMEG
ncbi:MAG: DNA translocase FtsK 4TM domain-containing protein [Porcipelethomonas sp.]